MPLDTDLYDFFVSYSRADNANGWISKFVDELISEHRDFSGGRELTCFFDLHEIHSFDDWQHQLRDGVQRSRLFLAFISPSYFASEWCRKEWKGWIDAEISKHILAGGAAPVYIVEVPGLLGAGSLNDREIARQIAELCLTALPDDDFLDDTTSVVRQVRRRQFSVAEPFYKQGLDALRREDLHELLKTLARDLGSRAEFVQRAANSPTTVPPYNKRFSGRLDELLNLRDRLRDDLSGVVCGIHGLGGVGKTELAFTFAHAFAGAYPGGRYEVRCEGMTTLRDALLNTDSLTSLYRDQMRESERKGPETNLAALVSWLRDRLNTAGHVLLILDNVTDLALLSHTETALLTVLGPGLHLLATSRLHPPSDMGWLTLGELPESDALDLFEKHRLIRDTDERHAAKEIVKRLGGYALAVELVSSWLSVHAEISCVSYLERLGLGDLDALDAAAADDEVELRTHNHERRISAVLGPTLDALSPIERRAVEYSAMLPPDAVALPWLRELVAAEFPEIDSGRMTGHPDPWATICRDLRRLALLSRSVGDSIDNQIVRIHRIVQKLVLNQMGSLSESLHSRLVAFVRARAQHLSYPTSWGRREDAWELQAAVAAADRWMADEREYGVEVAASITRALLGRHNYAEAHHLLEKATRLSPGLLGNDDPVTATCLNNKADLLREMNLLKESEELVQRALRIDEATFGMHHWRVARDYNNLGLIRHAQGRLNESQHTYEQAVDALNQALDKRDPESRILLPIVRHNLADLLCRMQQREDAIAGLRQAIVEFEEILGSAHPFLGTALNNLAVALHESGRAVEADAYYQSAIRVFEESIGPRSLRAATTLFHRALLLADNRRFHEALIDTQKSLDILVDLRLLKGRDDLFCDRVKRVYADLLIDAEASEKHFAQARHEYGINVKQPRFMLLSRFVRTLRRAVRRGLYHLKALY